MAQLAECLCSYSFDSKVVCVCFTANEKEMYVGTHKRLYRIDLTEDKVTVIDWTPVGTIITFTLSADDTKLVVCTDDRWTLFNTATDTIECVEWFGDVGQSFRAIFSIDLQYIFTIVQDNITQFDCETKTEIGTIVTHNSKVKSLVCDEYRLFVAGGSTVRSTFISTKGTLVEWTLPHTVHALALSERLARLFTSSHSGLTEWDIADPFTAPQLRTFSTVNLGHLETRGLSLIAGGGIGMYEWRLEHDANVSGPVIAYDCGGSLFGPPVSMGENYVVSGHREHKVCIWARSGTEKFSNTDLIACLPQHIPVDVISILWIYMGRPQFLRRTERETSKNIQRTCTVC